MPDYERPAVENERRLETASCRDPPANNYGAQLLERSLPPQQQQQQSGGRKRTGGIISRENYKGNPVEIRVPKWTDCNKLWVNSKDFETAQYIADAAFYLTGQLPFHFPDVKFDYLPLRLSTGEELTTREECSAYVAKIAKGSSLRGERNDYRDRVQKLILEMVKSPEVVRFLCIMRASPRQAWQPRPEANPEDTEIARFFASWLQPKDVGYFSGDENGTAMEVRTPSEEANQALAPTGTVDAAAVSQSDSTMASFYMDDMSTSFIAGFEMNLQYESENCLISAGQSLGIWYPRFAEKEKEDLVPDNYKEFLALLDKDEEEVWKSIEPLDVEL